MKDVWVLKLGFKILKFKFYVFKSDFWDLRLVLGFGVTVKVFRSEFLGLGLGLTFSGLNFKVFDPIFVVKVTIFKLNFRV
jgi:hypothetical protein